MKTFKDMAAQGDLLLIRIADLPMGITEVQPENGVHVVAHSETGHHHTVPGLARVYRDRSNDLICYLSCDAEIELEHHRSWDKHATIKIAPGNYELRRQREYTPQGFRRVED